MFEVSVSGWFAAAHQLRMPDGHVEPLHGHNWRVRVRVRGLRPDASGMLTDFVALKRHLDGLLAELHDRNLNDLPMFERHNPSAEHVAEYLAQRLAGAAEPPARLYCVQIEEAPGCVARYYPPGTVSADGPP
ncbi:MAG: 6-carboxytetrahydropterin synthase [Phycisphaerae bacterium]|jgi:6-pyruvoyltetrahydropterin/6-carboxytetrahydropterin synthase|nr:6-carboxytetrahydropterin synthase [Phycisphaerae bacterium]MCZ2400522.1 6-carboxytetrahydropterin synthase [Phycisphaerae bacterium]